MKTVFQVKWTTPVYNGFFMAGTYQNYEVTNSKYFETEEQAIIFKDKLLSAAILLQININPSVITLHLEEYK